LASHAAEKKVTEEQVSGLRSSGVGCQENHGPKGLLLLLRPDT
jgi:hypothetical protein